MKKYSIFDIIKYTPKSKDLSPYQVDIDNVKDKVMKNINGEEYVKKSNVSDENTSNTNPIVSVPVEIVKPQHKFGKSLILLCTCFLFVSGGAVAYSNIKDYSNFDTIGKSTDETSLNLGISNNIVEEKKFLRWLDFPSTADCTFQTFFNDISSSMYQSNFTLNEDDLQYISDTFYNLAHYMTDKDITELSPKYEFSISYPNENAPTGQENVLFKIYDVDQYNNIIIQVFYYSNNDIYGKREDIPEDDLFSINIERYQELISYLEDILKVSDNLTWDTQNKLFNILSTPSEAILNTWKDNIMDTYAINSDTLTELNNSLHYNTWEQLESNPFDYYNVDVPNFHTHDTINFYGEDGKYSITAYDIANYLIIEEVLNTGEVISYYFNTKDDNVYSELQKIAQQIKDSSITQSNENLSQLQLHENEIPVFNNEDELNQFIEKYSFENTTDAHIKIDDSKYIDMSFYVNNLNTLESKSHIYHKMLNSVEYYNTVEGNTTINFQGDVTIVEYQSDVRKIQSYCHTKSNNYDEEGFNSNDGDYIYINNIDKTITHENGGIFTGGDLLVPDNYKSVICNCEEEIPEVQQNNFQRNDITGIEYVGSESLLPQNMALSFMRDFNTWDITSTTTYLDRNCIVLEGTTSRNEKTFKFWVDIKTGILLRYQMGNGDTLVTNNIKIDEPLTVKKYSFNEYSTYEEIQ
ncbi:MAG: hypothetical protein ACI4WH_01100 [Oscillospiraceae bacterium]